MNKGLSSQEVNELAELTGKKGTKLMKYLETLIEEDQDNKYLNTYRGALSRWSELWEEYSNDTNNRVIVTLDGRDTAGKGSNIRRVTDYLDDKRYDVKAYGIPTLEEKKGFNWFNRYSKDFPEAGKVTFFDRSWYNRAGVEAAMGFCTQEEYSWFMEHVNQFEKDHIVDMGFDFVKVYLSIKKDTQIERLKGREKEMKRWKSSVIDSKAQEKWNYYTLAKKKILELTDSEHAPWLVLDSNKKFLSSIEIIKAIINKSDEISSIITKELSIDLSPNREVARTAQEELARMQAGPSIKDMKSKFKFAE